MDTEHNPYQCNLGYQVSLSGKGEWNKKTDYVGKAVLEKMGADIKAGKKPYKLQLVGLEIGGKPIGSPPFSPEINQKSGAYSSIGLPPNSIPTS